MVHNGLAVWFCRPTTPLQSNDKFSKAYKLYRLLCFRALRVAKTKMMKVLLSSKLLASELAKIDFENEQVFQVRGEGSNLIINTDKQTLELSVEMLQFEPRVKQENKRWDWVKKLVSCADEQPIVLDIHENVVNVIFQY